MLDTVFLCPHKGLDVRLPGEHKADWPSPTSHGLTIYGTGQRGWVPCELGCNQSWGPYQSEPLLQKLAHGPWNVTSLAKKKPKLVCKAEKSRQDIVGLSSTNCSSSGTSPLKRVWTLFHSGVTHGGRHRAGVDS